VNFLQAAPSARFAKPARLRDTSRLPARVAWHLAVTF
jgi:hypothetical protein